MPSITIIADVSGPAMLQKIVLPNYESHLLFYNDIINGEDIEAFLPGVSGFVGLRLDGTATIIESDVPERVLWSNPEKDSKLLEIRAFLVSNFPRSSFIRVSETAFCTFQEQHDYDWVRKDGAFSLFFNWVTKNMPEKDWMLLQ